MATCGTVFEGRPTSQACSPSFSLAVFLPIGQAKRYLRTTPVDDDDVNQAENVDTTGLTILSAADASKDVQSTSDYVQTVVFCMDSVEGNGRKATVWLPTHTMRASIILGKLT